MSNIGLRIVMKVRNDLYEHMIRLSNRFYAQGRTGDMISRIMSYVAYIQGAVTDVIVDLVKQPLVILFNIPMVFIWGGPNAIFAILIFPLVAVPITLLGKNVNSYGKNLDKGINFPGLLREIDKIASGSLAVDFVTSHPKDAGSDLFNAMAEMESLSKTLHLPLQSGSNKILKAMNRGYSVGKYKALVRDFRKIVNGSSLKTDFIVGFPGEREKDFEDTLKVMEEIRFNTAYIFKYSPRPFTAASKLKDDVPQAEKERRHAMLLKAQKKISMANAKLYAIR